MSKVVKVLAVVAFAVAVVVFAPAIGAALASVAGSLGVTVAGAAIASSLVGMAISIGLTAALSLFRKTPSMSSSMETRLNAAVSPVAPRKIVFGTTAAGNDIRFFETFGSKKDRYCQVLALASHKLSAISSFYVENDLAWQGGTIVDHADGIESIRAVTEGSSANGAPLGSGAYWTASSTFTACAYLAVTYKLSNDAWPNGVPQRVTTVVDGCPLYDPRRDSTNGGSGSHRADDQSTWTFAEGGVQIGRNPALALATYLLGWRYNGQLLWGMGVPATAIDWDNIRTYANLCEEQVAMQGGGSIQRYTCDGIFSTADTHETIFNGITAAMGSCKLVDRGGLYALIGGYDDTSGPTVDFTADDLVAAGGSSQPWVWQPAASTRESFNIVRGRFADPANQYQLADWGDPIVTDPLPDGIPRTMSLDLGCVSRPETCQRIAKQFLLREALGSGVFSALFGPKGYACHIGSLVRLSLPSERWNGKLFRVIEQTETHDLYFQMTLREESSAIYAWDREEKPLPASIRPGGYDPRDTINLQNLQITAQLVEGAG